MNSYRYNEIRVGMTESFSHTVTDEDIREFRRITGDDNPLHTDRDYAVNYGFKSEVVYGMLSASLISTMAGVYLPGRFGVLHQINEVKFAKPVYLDDTLIVKGIVKEMNDCVSQVLVKVEIFNQNNEKVIRASYNAGFVE